MIEAEVLEYLPHVSHTVPRLLCTGTVVLRIGNGNFTGPHSSQKLYRKTRKQASLQQHLVSTVPTKTLGVAGWLQLEKFKESSTDGLMYRSMGTRTPTQMGISG